MVLLCNSNPKPVEVDLSGIFMLLFLLAYLGGVVTIVSPCILPVLPFVFARAEQPFLRSGLPLLIGMGVTFAAISTLAAVAGGWAIQANQYGRVIAVTLLGVFGLVLLLPHWADRLARPLVALGARLSASATAQESESQKTNLLPSVLLGVATGLLWAPCAGPILGLILTGAALNGASFQTTLLLLAYAAGATTSLALALLAGGRVFAAMKRSLGAGEWLRRGLGVFVLAAVAVIALGLDTGALAQWSIASTGRLEQRLLDRLQGISSPKNTSQNLPIEGNFPSLDGAVEWLNSPVLSADTLKGKVVLIDFWTYSCINCLRSIPYVRAWSAKYKASGLVVIGVHAPEFAFEKNLDNVKKAVGDLQINYPVAVDNDYAIWRAFKNRYWPAHYLIDAQGQLRYHHFGEGNEDETERAIQRLLADRNAAPATSDLVKITAQGAQSAADLGNVQSSETYLGFARAERFVSPEGFDRTQSRLYSPGPPDLKLNDWSLSGRWTVGTEHAALNEKNGTIRYRFHARDLHLVLGPSIDGTPVRFQVLIDGKPPGSSNQGTDVDADGNGIIRDQRLYQLIRQNNTIPIQDHTFEIRFLDPGVQAYAFTFG
jgi:cytochrome c biogenesis protein CcdA/thiol-disulfide isomerase/thioredoxin